MTPIILIQGSPEWLRWRHEGIGASEVAALLGKDPYNKTPRILYEEKIKPLAEATAALEAEHLRQGHEVEAMVRAMHEFETGEDWPAACFEHPEYPFIRASLDGWNGKKVAEFKMVAGEMMGKPVPEHHVIQCQTQLLVTATDIATYVRHCRSLGVTERIEVAEDRTMQRDILAVCWQFWDDVQNKRPPAYIDADWVPDESLVEAVAVWRGCTTTRDKKNARAQLISMVQTPRAICQGVKIQRAPFGERVADTLKEKE